MEHKFTPGPWKAHRNCSYWEVSYKSDDQEEITEHSPSSAFAWGSNEEIAAANAKLIAAAPDLLQALEEIIHDVDRCDDNIGTWANCFDIAREVIAKATGAE